MPWSPMYASRNLKCNSETEGQRGLTLPSLAGVLEDEEELWFVLASQEKKAEERK